MAPITAEKVLQLYEFRCVLEKFAADRSEGLISLKELDRVTSKFDYIAAELDQRNVQPFNDADFEFHQLFIGRCGNPLIVSQLAKLESQLKRVMNYFGTQGRPHQARSRRSTRNRRGNPFTEAGRSSDRPSNGTFLPLDAACQRSYANSRAVLLAD